MSPARTGRTSTPAAAGAAIWRRLSASVSRRRGIVAALLAVLLGAGCWLLIGQAAHYGSLLGQLHKVDPPWLIVCLAGELLAYTAYAFMYRAVVRAAGGPRPGFRLSLRVVIASFNAIAVATSAGSLAVDYWALSRMGEKRADAAARVLALNTAQWAMLSIGAAVSALALLLGAGPMPPLAVALAWIATVSFCVIAATWISAPARRHLAADRGGRARRGLATAVRGLVILRAALSSRQDCLWLVGGGALFWAGELLCAWAGLRAFGYSISAPAITLAFATGYASTTLPLPAGGSGGVDAARTYALTLVGVPFRTAVLGTFVARLFTFWLPLAVAGLLLPSLRRLRTDLPAVSPRGDPAPD